MSLHHLNNLNPVKEKRILLRKHQTKAESVLWSYVRARKLGGYKFYQQFSVGQFILDFYCHEEKFAIELDGETHKNQSEYDDNRTFWLKDQGISVIRFWNNQVIRNPKEICEIILKEIKINHNSLG